MIKKNNIFQANTDMVANISNCHIDCLEQLIKHIKAILNSQAKSLEWFPYRPGRSRATEYAVDIQSIGGNSVSLTIHIDTENTYPDYNLNPQPYRNQESLELTVTDAVDAHHLVLWLALKLKLKAATIAEQGISFGSFKKGEVK